MFHGGRLEELDSIKEKNERLPRFYKRTLVAPTGVQKSILVNFDGGKDKYLVTA